MSKGKLEFQLPEEQEDFETAQKGWHYRIIIEELDNYLRSKIKYSELTEEQHAIYDEIRSELWRLRND